MGGPIFPGVGLDKLLTLPDSVTLRSGKENMFETIRPSKNAIRAYIQSSLPYLELQRAALPPDLQFKIYFIHVIGEIRVSKEVRPLLEQIQLTYGRSNLYFGPSRTIGEQGEIRHPHVKITQ